jgi:hypothetical protein
MSKQGTKTAYVTRSICTIGPIQLNQREGSHFPSAGLPDFLAQHNMPSLNGNSFLKIVISKVFWYQNILSGNPAALALFQWPSQVRA